MGHGAYCLYLDLNDVKRFRAIPNEHSIDNDNRDSLVKYIQRRCVENEKYVHAVEYTVM